MIIATPILAVPPYNDAILSRTKNIPFINLPRTQATWPIINVEF